MDLAKPGAYINTYNIIKQYFLLQNNSEFAHEYRLISSLFSVVCNNEKSYNLFWPQIKQTRSEIKNVYAKSNILSGQ